MHPRTPPEEAPKPTRQDFDFVSSTYLPSIGADSSLSESQDAMLVSLLNLAQTTGQPLQGILAMTQTPFHGLSVLSTLGGGIHSLVIWPFSRKLWSLVIYSFAFRATVGGFDVLRAQFATAALGDDRNSTGVTSRSSSSEDAVEDNGNGTGHDGEKEVRQKSKFLFIFGVFTAAYCINIFASRFIAAELVNEDSTDLSGYGCGLKWQSLVISTGVMGDKFVPHYPKIGKEDKRRVRHLLSSDKWQSGGRKLH